MTEIDTQTAALAKLREKFPDESISKRPVSSCKDCSRNNCAKHEKKKCKDCGAWITTSHVHLDYVGHAETTDRLLDADLTWSWTPMALTPQGLPLFDEFGGMWIYLTIGGVTRLGYGSADGKTGPNAIKEVIGDAIRNSSMRFGVALDLWAKTDLHADEHHQDEPEQAATDSVWLAAVKQRIADASDVDALNVVGEDIRSQADAGRLAYADGNALRVLFDARMEALDNREQDAPPAAEGAVKRMHALFHQLGLRDRQGRLLRISEVLGRQVITSAGLSQVDVQAVIKALETDLAARGPSPSDEGIDVMDALTQLIDDAHDETSFEDARADIEREHAAGALGGDQLAALQARWVDRRGAMLAGVSS